MVVDFVRDWSTKTELPVEKFVGWLGVARGKFLTGAPARGYRRLTSMMLDQDVGAASPASVYRVLSAAGLLDRWNRKPSKNGTGFVQPVLPHEHWHIDFQHLNIAYTFYYLCLVLDGASRAIVHWDLR